MLGLPLTDEQRLLRDSASDYLASTHDADRARAFRDGGGGHDAAFWKGIGDLGWLAARLPEGLGGLGLELPEICLIARELGRAGAPDPFVFGGVMPAVILARSGSDAALAWAERLAGGEISIGVADQEAPFAPGSGTRLLVRGGIPGGLSLLPVHVGGTARIVALEEVPEGAVDATIEQDGSIALSIDPAAIDLDRATVLLHGPEADEAWQAARSEGVVALSQQLAGLSRGLLAHTVDYLAQRVQFDRKIVSFQAIQHRLVDLHVAVQLAETSCDHALSRHGAAHEEARISGHAAKARCSTVAMDVARAAIQLHGAIGYTDESVISPYVRQAMTLAQCLGNASHHRQQVWRLTQQRSRQDG